MVSLTIIMAFHPFYRLSGEWVDAADLLPGDLICTLDGSYSEVASMRIVEREQIKVDAPPRLPGLG